MSHLIISFITPDKPGVVDTLSNIINKHQGNWQKSSLHQIAGFFSGVIDIAIEAKQTDALISELSTLKGFKIQWEKADSNDSQAETHLILELTANDRAGIVQEIASTIHQQNGNLVKLVSSQESAAHSGQDIFKAKLTLTVKDDLEDMIAALESLADDLMIDISK